MNIGESICFKGMMKLSAIQQSTHSRIVLKTSC